MKTLNFPVPIEDTPFGQKIVRNLLGEYDFPRSDSEPRIKYFTLHIGGLSALFQNGIRDSANRLIRIAGEGTLEDVDEIPCVTELTRRKSLPFGRFSNGDAFELPEVDLDNDLDSLLSLYYIRLPWNKVRLPVSENGNDKGYFISFGWNPISNELFYDGFDFVHYRTKEENSERLAHVPKRRGLPDDLIQTLANCGPTSLAAFKNISSAEALELLGWSLDPSDPEQYAGMTALTKALSIGEIKYKNCRLHDEPESLEEAFSRNEAGLALIRGITTKDGKPHKETFGHWIAYDRGFVYDCNARQTDGTLGDWVQEKKWNKEILGFSMPLDYIGYFVRNILVRK